MDIKEIAKLSGVSKSTVSRVLNDSELVNKFTKKKVLEVIETTGYYPNNIARSLKIRKTKTIGVLLADIGNPFYFEVLRGIEKKLYSENFNIMLCSSDYDESRELRYLSLLASKKVDGIIVAPSSENYKGIEQLKKWGIPFVLIDIPYLNIKTNGVFVDHSICSKLATDYLINNNHKRIAIIDVKLRNQKKSRFFTGYAETLKENKIPLDENLIIETYPDINNGYLAIRKLVKDAIYFSAVITINDLLSVGVYMAAKRLKLKIPEDISVVGNDNITLSRFLSPPLTTINQPKLSLGYKSAELLLKNINEKHVDAANTQTIILGVKLIKRGSVINRDKGFE